MPRRGERMLKTFPGDPSDPYGLTAWMLRFLESMRVKQYTDRTVGYRESSLGYFITWCHERSLTRPGDITRPILQRYQRYLFHYRKENGKPLTASCQHGRLVAIRMYFKWLTRENVLLSNPASELELPKRPQGLPRSVLNPSEAEAVLALPDITEPLGIRDRALLETVYSTGLRRTELVNLALFDLDWETGTVMVREGKGKKDRVVPIGERALAWCEKYLREVRPELVVPPDTGALFLTRNGEPAGGHYLSQIVRGYVDAADLGKTGSCHLFRHTMATAMLEGGADVRFIQEMLGHADLSTTQIYTRVSIRKLKEIHAATHPSARLYRKSDEEEAANGEPG
jgi:integrase/recombinase XerD